MGVRDRVRGREKDRERERKREKREERGERREGGKSDIFMSNIVYVSKFWMRSLIVFACGCARARVCGCVGVRV